MKAKKVAVFVPSLASGGAEWTNVTWANEFAKHGLSVDLVVVDAEGPFRRAVAGNVRIVVLGSRRCMTSLPRFCRYLRRENPDAVLATMRAGTVALLADRIVGGRRRTVVRSEMCPSGDRRISDALGRLLLRLHCRLLPSADAVVTVCEDAAADIARASPKASAKVRVVHYPLFIPGILDLADQPVAHPWFNGSTAPVMVAVGRLAPQKDYLTLLHAFADVLRVRPARLVIVGEGPERSRLLATTRELGIAEHVDLPGYRENPYAYVRRARVFVLSSIAEGLPRALLEALACGTPVVSTACVTGPGEILEGGKWGRLVPVGDSEAMAEAILSTLDESVDSSALVARAKVFDSASSVDQHLELLFPNGWSSHAAEAMPVR